MNPLDLIPRWVLLLALAAAGIFAGAQTIRLSSEQDDHATTKAEHAAQLQVLAENAREAEKKAREEEQRRTAEVQKAADEAEQARLAAQADAAAARDVGQRLRAQLAALTANHRGATGNPNAPRPGPGDKDSGALDLLAEMLARHTAELVEVGEYADRLRVAGQACERAYDALTP
jgi:hypothetical protein